MESNNNGGLVVAGIVVVSVVAAGLLGFNMGKQEGMGSMHMDMDMVKTSKEASKDHAQMTMDEMTRGLNGLKGDAFDKAFVEMMIVHHQGAVDMAKLIPANAKHAELKKLGQDIITAQTQEITMMKKWLKDWGYENTNSQPMDMNMEGMDHSMMGH